MMIASALIWLLEKSNNKVQKGLLFDRKKEPGVTTQIINNTKHTNKQNKNQSKHKTTNIITQTSINNNYDNDC